MIEIKRSSGREKGKKGGGSSKLREETGKETRGGDLAMSKHK